MAPLRLTPAQARHAWFTRQRLAETPSVVSSTGAGASARGRTLAETVGDLAWIPLPSPATAYLALFARRALTARAELDDALCRRGELVVVPGPRGASWLVPTLDAPVCRAFAVADHASREARVAAAVTLTPPDLQGAREALRAALATPCAPEEIRQKIPDRFLRSLGDAGRKAGLPTVAALVLRSMWVNGEVMRVSADGRLDGPGVRWSIDPRPRTVPTAAEAVTVIAPRWLAAHGPVSARAFAAAFGIAAGRANGALKGLKLVEVEVEGVEGTLLAPADFAHLPLGVDGETGAGLPARLLPARDPLTDVHLSELADAATARAAMSRAGWVGPTAFAGGALWASWQYDPGTRAIVWRSLGASPPVEIAAALDAEAQRMAAFIAGELGGAAALHSAPPPGAARRPSVVPAGELSIEF